MARELRETAYQFDRPFMMDSTLAQETFGVTPTPLDEVLAESVPGLRPAAAAR